MQSAVLEARKPHARSRGRKDDDFHDAPRLGRRTFGIHARLLYSFLPNGSPDQIKAYANLQRARQRRPKTAIRILIVQDETDIRHILPNVKAPTIVFHSRHDNVVPFEQGRLVAASIPNAEFVPLEGANHVLLSDEPAFFALSIDSKSFSFGAAEEDALRRRIAEFATVNVRFWRNRDLPLGSRKVRSQAPAQSASVTNLGAKLPLRLALADRLLSARMRTFLSSLPDHKSGH